MARLNEAAMDVVFDQVLVQPSAHSERESPESGDAHESSENERTASMIRAARKSKAGGIFSSVGKFLGLRRPSAGDAEENPALSEEPGEEASEALGFTDGTSNPPAESIAEEASNSQPVHYPELPQVANDKPTRRRPAVRPDNYEVPDDAREDEVEEAAPSTPSRSSKNSRRVALKAKVPIVSPRKSNGEILHISPRQTRSRKPSKPTNTATDGAPRISDEDKIVDSESRLGSASNQVPRKRGPGRGKRGRPPTKILDGGSSAQAAEAPISAEVGDVEGVSSILLDPSPIKVIPPAKAFNDVMNPTSDDDLPAPERIGQRHTKTQKGANEGTNMTSTPAATLQPKFAFLKIERLQSMLETAKRVGYTKKKDSDEWELVKEPTKVFSNLGRKFLRQMDGLKGLYEKVSDEETTQDAINDAFALITEEIQNIKATMDNALSRRLGSKSTGVRYLDETETEQRATRSLLVDIYFRILPTLLESICFSAQAYSEDGDIDTSALREFQDLLDLYHRLANIAIEQPKECQPQLSQIPSNVKSKLQDCQIKRPTIRVIPLIRELRKETKQELETRRFAEPAEEWSSSAPQRIKRRQEEALIQEQSKRQKIDEIHRKQREDLARQMAEPVWGEILREEIARSQSASEAKAAEKTFEAARMRSFQSAGRTGVRNSTYQGIDGEQEQIEDEEDDPFADDPASDHSIERVRFFPGNHQQESSQAWSDAKQAAFVDFMRAYDGDDRYFQLAEQFQCSLEEVFDYAKEFQIAMDDAHKSGLFNEEGDEWTYKVWPEGM